MPGLKQEQLDANPPHCLTLSGVPNKSIFQNGHAFISEDAYFCKEKEREHLVIYKSMLKKKKHNILDSFPQKAAVREMG